MVFDLDEFGYAIDSTGRKIDNVELTETPLSVFKFVADYADKNKDGFNKRDLKKLDKYDLGDAIVRKLFAEGDYNLREISLTKKSIHLTMYNTKGQERNLEIEFLQKNIGAFLKKIFKPKKPHKSLEKDSGTSIQVGKLEEIPTETKKIKDSIAFLQALGEQETKGEENPYFCINRYGYVGRYQMGEQAMAEMNIYSKKNKNYNNDWSGVFKKNKYGITSLWDYRNSPEKQEMLQIDYKKRVWVQIKNKGLDKFVGTTINDILITESGLLAGAHLVGAGGLSRYLKSNGNVDVKDKTGTSVTKYLKLFAGYDVSDIAN